MMLFDGNPTPNNFEHSITGTLPKACLHPHLLAPMTGRAFQGAGNMVVGLVGIMTILTNRSSEAECEEWMNVRLDGLKESTGNQ